MTQVVLTFCGKIMLDPGSKPIFFRKSSISVTPLLFADPWGTRQRWVWTSSLDYINPPQGRSKDQETEMFKGWNVVIINRSNSRKRSPWACLVFEFRTEWSRSIGFHMSQAVSISPFVNPQPGVRRVAVVMCLFQKWVIQSCDTQYIHFHDIFTNAPFYSTRITTFPTCFWLAKYSYASFAWSKLNTLSTIGVIFLALISRFISSNLDAIQYPKRSCGFEESTHCEREPIKMERNITALWSISPVIPFKSSPWSWYYVWIE